MILVSDLIVNFTLNQANKTQKLNILPTHIERTEQQTPAGQHLDHEVEQQE